MIQKNELDEIFEALSQEYGDESEYDRLLRDTHLGVALIDAGKPLSPEIDTRVAEILQKFSRSSA